MELQKTYSWYKRFVGIDATTDMPRSSDSDEDQDQAAWDAHLKTDYFQALGKTLGEENLLAGPLDIKTIKPFAGFASR